MPTTGVQTRGKLDIVSNKSVMLSFMENTLTGKNSGFSHFSRYFPHAIETKEKATFEKNCNLFLLVQNLRKGFILKICVYSTKPIG